MNDIKRPKPKLLRPVIRQPVADRVWLHCQVNGLILEVLVTKLVEAWLNEQEQANSDQIAS